MSDIEEKVARIREQATQLHRIVRSQARRAYVVEITGTPKAGKSSGIELMDRFFRSCGWTVHVVRERAAECPLPMKGHFFFNTWTTCTMLAETLEVADSAQDLVILDRGFFDALVWLELQEARKQLGEGEYEAFSSFVLLDRWRSLVDATVVMEVDPTTALQREDAGQLIARRGTLMSEAGLEEFNHVLQTAKEKHPVFPVIEVDAGGEDQKATIALAIEQLLKRIDAWADPEVAAVPHSTLKEIFQGSRTLPCTDESWRSIADVVEFHRRSEIEEDERYVQLVAAGVEQFRGEGVFAFERHERDERRRLYGRATIWRGCHVERPPTGLISLDYLAEALKRRLQESLHLAGLPMSPRPLGLVWIDQEVLRRHMGVVFGVPIDDPFVKRHLEDKAFKTNGRGHPLLSRFHGAARLLEQKETIGLEPWSAEILEKDWLGNAP